MGLLSSFITGGPILKTPESANRAPSINQLEAFMVRAVMEETDKSVEGGMAAVARHGRLSHLPGIQYNMARPAIFAAKDTLSSTNLVSAPATLEDAVDALLLGERIANAGQHPNPPTSNPQETGSADEHTGGIGGKVIKVDFARRQVAEQFPKAA